MDVIHYNILIYNYQSAVIPLFITHMYLKFTFLVSRCPLLPAALVGLQNSHQLVPSSNAPPSPSALLLKCFMGASAPSCTVQNVNTAQPPLSHSPASLCPSPSWISTPSRCPSSSEGRLRCSQGLGLGRPSILTSP